MATKTYEEVVLEDSPEFLLRLDETSGTTASDSSGNGRDFTHSGSPTLDQTGPVNKAVSYDGSNDHTTLTPGFSISYPFTMAYWAKTPGSPASDENYCYFSLSDSSTKTGHISIQLRTVSGSLKARFNRGSGVVVDTIDIPDSLIGEWVKIVAVFNSDTDRYMVINGVKSETFTDSLGLTLGDVDRITLGGVDRSNVGDPDIFTEGLLAEAALFSSGLSDERSRIHHTVGRGFTEQNSYQYAVMVDGPAIYLRMNDASGDAQDSSGWLRHATAAGSPTYSEPGPIVSNVSDDDDAIKLNGTDAAFALAGDDLGITAYPLTIEMFGKTPSSPSNSTTYARLMFGDDGTEDNFFGLDLTTDAGGNPEVRGVLETGGTADNSHDTTDRNTDEYYHIVWRLVSATERKLYVNNTLEVTDTDSRAFGSNIDDLVIGRDLSGTPNFYAGTMGQILVFPRDIGESAVGTHYLAAISSFYSRSITDNFSLDESTSLLFVNTIEETLGLKESIIIKWSKSLVDAFGLHDALSTVMLFKQALTEGFSLDDTPSGVMVANNTIVDGLGFDDTASATAQLKNLITEGISFQIGLSLEDESYTGLVVNTKNFALTRYTGYNFNSFAATGGEYYGAAGDGIYHLEGDDDAGTQINAAIKTAAMNFGTDFQKRVPRAYLGLRGDGELYLKTITNEDEEFWYRISNVRSTFHNHRAKLGRGVKATYWQFELSNEEDGSFFELDSMTLIPVLLTKRVKC